MTRIRAHGNCRDGFTLAEILAAILLLSAAMLLTAQLASVSAMQRRAAEQKELALNEADSLLERLTALPPARLTSDYLAGQVLSPAGARLPGGQLRVEAADMTEPAGKRLQVQVDWLLPSGARAAPVALTAWVYAQPPTKGERVQ